MSRLIVVIPARFGSTRYPGKPLVPIRGAGGKAKTLLARTIDAARQMAVPARLIVATDDDRIAAAAQAQGAEVAITPSSCGNGTERVAAAIQSLDVNVQDIILNWQGDSLLTPARFADRLVAHMRAAPACLVATPATPCTPGLYAHLLADQAAGRSGGTTVVAAGNQALYFSKRVLPFVPANHRAPETEVRLHLGLYAYRAVALARYCAAAPTKLEQLEGLEQLRFLELGMPIDLVSCPLADRDLIELNNPGDLAFIEAELVRLGLA